MVAVIHDDDDDDDDAEKGKNINIRTVRVLLLLYAAYITVVRRPRVVAGYEQHSTSYLNVENRGCGRREKR